MLSSTSPFGVQCSIAKLCSTLRKSSRSENFHRAKSSFLFDRANLLISLLLLHVMAYLCLCIQSRASSFNLFSDLKHDFKIFIALNALSGVHEVTRIMTAILKGVRKGVGGVKTPP